MIPAYLEPDQKKKLGLLSEVTRVPMTVYIREAIDDLLQKYASAIRRAEKEGTKFRLRLKRRYATPRR